MKKTIRIIAVCLSLIAISALVTGCDALDEMKANHAILSEDREALSFRGETYKKLPEGEEFYVGATYGESFDDISVTDADVPVLLSSANHHYCDYDKANDIFAVDIYAPLYSDGFSTSYISDVTTYYCNEKDYDKYMKALENDGLDYIGVEYEVIDNDGWYYTVEAFSKEFSEELLDYIKNPDKMSEEVFSGISYSFEFYDTFSSGLYKCDSEALIAQYLDSYSIARDSNGNCYFVDHYGERAVKLSEKFTKEIKDEYFYGYSDTIMWSDEEYDDSVGIIGSADGPTTIFID